MTSVDINKREVQCMENFSMILGRERSLERYTIEDYIAYLEDGDVIDHIVKYWGISWYQYEYKLATEIVAFRAWHG